MLALKAGKPLNLDVILDQLKSERAIILAPPNCAAVKNCLKPANVFPIVALTGLFKVPLW